MKRPTFLALLATATLSAPIARAQNVGDSVTTEALGKLEWIQGGAPAEWEPGRLYVLECWATWCGPCVAAIPHVDALFDKYADKGLRVIGVDVWEDGKDKVAAFVKKKGDGMSYPVGYTGKGGFFEEKWLKTAGVTGIPHTFLVQDGKVIGMAHPGNLTDEVVEGLLKGGDDQKAALEKINEASGRNLSMGKAQIAFQDASKKHDADAMQAAIDKMRELDPKNKLTDLFETDVQVARRDWDGIGKVADSDMEVHQLRGVMIRAVMLTMDEVPVDTLKKVIAAYEKGDAAFAAQGNRQIFDAINLARLCWKAGDRDKALAHANDALTVMKTMTAKNPKMRIGAYEKFVAAIQGGTMPAEEEFGKWVQEDRTAAAE
jgi:thiol-disulfide isomerase/thioredoxin